MDSDAEAMSSEIATDGEQRSSESERNSEEVPLDRGIVPYNYEPSDTDSSSASLSSSDSGTENKNQGLSDLSW